MLELFDVSALSASAPDHPDLPICSLIKLTRVSVGGGLELPNYLSGRSERFYITDGGHSENLALFPLIRRRCNRLIAVDAEYDPWLVFDGYHRLQESLLSRRVKLQVPGIEEISEDRFEKCMPNEICYVKPKNKNDIQANKIQKPVWQGSVIYEDGLAENEAELLYVKLAYSKEQARIGEFGQKIKNYIDDIRLSRNGGEGEDIFPHFPTTDQHLDENQLDALFELGRYLGWKNIRSYLIERVEK